MAKRDYSKLSQAKLRQLEKNPGERSKIPTNLLSQSYRAQREQNTYNAAPVTPGSSYTNRDASREVNSTVDQKYGAAERQSNAQVAAIPQWYQNFRQQEQAFQQGQQAGQQAAVGQFQALQAGTTAQQGQQAVQGYQAQAAQLGQVADPAAQARAAQAAAVRGAAVGDLGSVLAAQGAAQTAYGAQQLANTGQSQVEALQKELDSQRQLKLEKGSYATTTRQGIVDRERKQLLENKAFDLNVANTVQDNKTAEENSRTQRINANTQRINSTTSTAGPGGTYSKTEWAKMTPAQRTKAVADYNRATRKPSSSNGSSANGAKPATPAQRNTANTQIQYALTQARRLKQGKYARPQSAQTLVTGRPGASGQPGVNKVPQLYASVALDVAYDGHVSRANAKKLHDLGLTVKDLGLPSYTAQRGSGR